MINGLRFAFFIFFKSGHKTNEYDTTRAHLHNYFGFLESEISKFFLKYADDRNPKNYVKISIFV